MLSVIPGESRWSTLCILESGSEPRYVLSITCATLCRRTLGGNAEIASESCVPRAMKNSLCRPGVLAATGRQLLTWLPAPFLFHYFTFHLEWRLKVLQQAIISPRRLLSVCPAADSEPHTALLPFWQIPRLLIFVYQCFFSTFDYWLLACTVTVLCRNLLAGWYWYKWCSNSINIWYYSNLIKWILIWLLNNISLLVLGQNYSL